MTERILTWWKKARPSFALFVGGISVGWLVGLSISPVIQGVLTGLIALAIGVAGILSGIKAPIERAGPKQQSATESGQQRKPRAIIASPIPVAFLAMGVAAGATTGLYARTHGWLGTLAQDVAWDRNDPRLGVLFGHVAPDECRRLRSTPPDHLERVMRSSSNPRVRAFADRCAGHPECLKAAVEELLCPESK